MSGNEKKCGKAAVIDHACDQVDIHDASGSNVIRRVEPGSVLVIILADGVSGVVT